MFILQNLSSRKQLFCAEDWKKYPKKKNYCSTWLVLLCYLPIVDAELLFDTNIYTLTLWKLKHYLLIRWIFSTSSNPVWVGNILNQSSLYAGRTAEAKNIQNDCHQKNCMHLEWVCSVSRFIQDQEKKASWMSISLKWKGAKTSSLAWHSLYGKKSPACWLITTQQFIHNIPHWVCSREYLLTQATHTCPETQDRCAVINQPAGNMFALPSSVCHESNWRWWLVWLTGYGEVSLLLYCFGVILLFKHKQENKKLWKKLAKLLWAREKKRWGSSKKE